MKVIIQSTLKTLDKTNLLLQSLSNGQLCCNTPPPYYSSIGTHVRHILDFYDCLFNVNFENKIDLTARKRDNKVESDCEYAINYLNAIIEKLNILKFKAEDKVMIIDDLGLGKTEIPYTYGALLAQANSHAIHHYAIINYILSGFNILVNDDEFGYNPTTPKQIL